jgi:hypothetical protein
MKDRPVILALHVALFLGLLYAYKEYVVPIYGYDGYTYQPDEAMLPVVFGAVLLLSALTPIAYQKPSTVFYQLMLTMTIIPMLVLFYAEKQPWEYVAQVMAAYVVTIAVKPLLSFGPPKALSVSKQKLRLILFGAAWLYIIAVLLMGGAAYINFDFSRIYDLRREAADNLPGMFGYISPLVAQVIIPTGFVLCLLYKKRLMAILLLLASALVFALTTHKSTLFIPFMLLFIYTVSLSKNLIFKFNVGLLLVVTIATIDFWLWKNYSQDFFGWTGTLTLARVFFLPSQLNYVYYDFFSRNEWVWFSDSKLTLGLLDYPYTLGVPHLIGLEYFNSKSAGANTGWLGSGYMQAGFFGLILYAVIIAAIFRYIDACARLSGERALITAMLAVPVTTLFSSADLPTTMLTHGMLLCLILIACFRRSEGSAEAVTGNPAVQESRLMPGMAARKAHLARLNQSAGIGKAAHAGHMGQSEGI